MPSIHTIGASSAPPILLQADRVRRRIATSDSVALLLSELAFGPTRRSDLATLAAVTTSRCAAAGVGVRS